MAGRMDKKLRNILLIAVPAVILVLVAVYFLLGTNNPVGNVIDSSGAIPKSADKRKISEIYLGNFSGAEMRADLKNKKLWAFQPTDEALVRKVDAENDGFTLKSKLKGGAISNFRSDYSFIKDWNGSFYGKESKQKWLMEITFTDGSVNKTYLYGDFPENWNAFLEGMAILAGEDTLQILGLELPKNQTEPTTVSPSK